jgi:hypothetical protein
MIVISLFLKTVQNVVLEHCDPYLLPVSEKYDGIYRQEFQLWFEGFEWLLEACVEEAHVVVRRVGTDAQNPINASLDLKV